MGGVSDDSQLVKHAPQTFPVQSAFLCAAGAAGPCFLHSVPVCILLLGEPFLPVFNRVAARAGRQSERGLSLLPFFFSGGGWMLLREARR